jgi:hypothetical protein
LGSGRTDGGLGDAALLRFDELIHEQRAIFREQQRRGKSVARSLSPRPFQGVVEALQNADDLRASELRIAVVRSGRQRQLLMVHDGDRIQLHHVGAMVLPWLSTKEDDPDASGQFGIGQQTLQSLGGPLEVHCAPFPFRIEPDGLDICGRVSPIDGLYAPEKNETLFVGTVVFGHRVNNFPRVLPLRLRGVVLLVTGRRLASNGEHRTVEVLGVWRRGGRPRRAS